jgi:hypothetical protein
MREDRATHSITEMSQRSFASAEYAMKKKRTRREKLRDFVGIDLSRESVPDATTLLKFRRLLLDNDLTKALFDQERGQHARSRDASDQEGQRLALRHESAHRCGPGRVSCTRWSPRRPTSTT